VEGGDVYRDQRGVRLMSLWYVAWTSDRLLLSGVSRHPGKRVSRSFSALRTPHGVGLGTTRASLLRRLGRPSQCYRSGVYQILCYLSRPKPCRQLYREGSFSQGFANAYALRGGRVVEILIQSWDDVPRG
jgi:hypothetical protein